MRRRGAVRITAVVTSVILAAVALAAIDRPQSAEAVTGAEFNPALIISDSNFYDANAMTEAEIQAFLNAKVGACNNGRCLNVLRTDTFNRAPDKMCPGGYVGEINVSIARLIFKTQQNCGISAKVILVTLQKEQGLVTSKQPSETAIRIAMGYGCPDTAACDSTYYGIHNQIYQAARQLKRYGLGPPENTTFTWFPVGRPSAVRYSPNAACGASTITIQNKATAALYYYTPYQPNAAALANLYGTGDTCSAYGNRNFWRYYNDWFGPPAFPPGTPLGELTDVAVLPGAIRVTGWAIDPDAPTGTVPVAVQIATGWFSTQANLPNPAAGLAVPGAGDNHGIDATFATPPGQTRVCVTSVNIAGPGGNQSFSCRFVWVPAAPAPVGEATATAGPSSITLTGWAVRPDAPTGAVTLAANIGSSWYGANTGQPNSIAPTKVSGAGANQGYSVTIPAPAGTHTVCMWGIPTSGPPVSFACATATVVPPPLARGAIVSVTGGVGSLTVKGWAVQPDVPTAISNSALNIGSGWYSVTANQPSAEAAAAIPAAGPNHGFTATIPVPAGTHTVCLWATSSGGIPSSVGCATGTATVAPPARGALDALTGVPGGVSFSGWAARPEAPTASVVVALETGSGWYGFSTGTPNSVAPTVVAGAGPNQGYSGFLALPPGAQSACVWIAGATGAVNLGCRTVTVPSAAIVRGDITSVTASPGVINFTGWFVRPDAPTVQVPLAVHTGSTWLGFSTGAANAVAPTVVPGAGPNQGVVGSFSAPRGLQSFCLWAVTSAGVAVNVDCASVNVP